MRFLEYLSESEYPEIDKRIEEFRKKGSPRVKDLLAYLSRAEKAKHNGDHDEAERLKNKALAEKGG
jgi:hypothetical protein